MPLDDWSAPPTPPLRESLSPAPTLFDNTFANIPRIDLHPTSSDASSSSTLATSSVATLNETSSDETSSSLRTTPEFDDDGGKCSSKAALDLTDQVSKQIEAEAAQVQQQNAAGTTDSSTTRRRSMRIKTMVVPSKETPTATRSTATTAPLTATIASEPTTPATATSPAAGDPPHTPSSRSKPAPDTASPADGDAPSTAKRSLRSSVRKPQRESQSGPKTENQSKSTPAAQLATESETSRRTSKRISAIYAHASGTPNAKSGKRAHDVMMADSKKSGSYSKKTKIEHGSDSGVSVSSSSSSRSSEAPSTSSEESVGPPVKRRKVWLEHGMYLGQEDGDLKLRPGSKGKKGKKTSRAETIPLPIFRGKDIMEITRDFKLPHAVFAPSATRCPNPPDWRKLNHSRNFIRRLCRTRLTRGYTDQLIGDAQQIWKREKPDNAKCICVLHCTDRCHNAACWIECTSKNCNAGRQCGNRSFADLTDRVKKETKFATGVEVALVRTSILVVIPPTNCTDSEPWIWPESPEIF